MKIMIAGGTGFIGSILVDRLWNQFHSLVLLSRKPPAEVGVSKKEWFAWNPPAGGAWEAALEGADGIINLLGNRSPASVGAKSRKKNCAQVASIATRALVNAIAKAKVKPKFLVNASAVGYYGAHGDETVTEATRRAAIFCPGCAWTGRRSAQG